MHRSASPLSRQDEFARHGFREGYPLWNPDPVLLPQDRQDKGLEIGDIGTVDEDGCFITVFNIYHSPDPALMGYTPSGEPNIYVHETFHAGHVFSSPETSWRNEERGAPYYTGPHSANHGRMITQYTSSLSKDGAHIIVPQGATCSKLASRDQFIFKSAAADPGRRATWFNFANNHLGFRPSTLYLITGLCQTHSWSLASFNRNDEREVRVCCELVEEDGKLQMGRAGSHWTPRGRFAYKIGPPIERQGSDNQTIFIQSFAITHNGNVQPLRPRQLTTAVTRGQPMGRGTTAARVSHRGTNNDRRLTSSQHVGRYRGANMAAATLAIESTATIQHIPPTSPASHPSEIINRYLLTKQPSANAAVTHDGLWITMLKKGQLSKLQDLEIVLDALVSEHYLIVLSNGVVYLRDNLLSLRRFGIESPADLTDCVKQDDEVPFSRHSFGDIYQGTLCMPRRTIKAAIKVIKIGPTNDSSLSKKRDVQLERVQRMIEVWSELDHTNVLPLIWTTEDRGRFSMVSPWAENGTLTSYLEGMHKELTDVQRLTLINDVASGLHYLHSKNILHGGLSGSNIAVDARGTALLSEFSRVTLLDEHSPLLFAQSKQEIDTLRWAAPESLAIWNKPKTVLTKESDIYSFGSIMLQILSGKVPYHDYGTKEAIIAAISRNDTPRRPSDDPRLTDRRWKFMQQCWLPSEANASRPSITEVVLFCAQELAQVVKMRNTGTGLPTTTQPSGKPVSEPPVTQIPRSGLLATRVTGLPSASLPPSGLPATRLRGTPTTRVGGQPSARLTPSGSSAIRLSGMRPLSSERNAPVKHKH